MALVYLLRWLGFMDNKKVVRPSVWNFALYVIVASSLFILLLTTGVLDPALR